MSTETCPSVLHTVCSYDVDLDLSLNLLVGNIMMHRIKLLGHAFYFLFGVQGFVGLGRGGRGGGHIGEGEG